MKLQLTKTAKQYRKILKRDRFTDMYMEGLKELINELSSDSFDDLDHLIEYSNHVDILLDTPIKGSFLVSEGIRLEFIELV